MTSDKSEFIYRVFGLSYKKCGVYCIYNTPGFAHREGIPLRSGLPGGIRGRPEVPKIFHISIENIWGF